MDEFHTGESEAWQIVSELETLLGRYMLNRRIWDASVLEKHTNIIKEKRDLLQTCVEERFLGAKEWETSYMKKILGYDWLQKG